MDHKGKKIIIEVRDLDLFLKKEELSECLKEFYKIERQEKKKVKKTKGKAKVEKVMHEYKEGKLHSGSKKGPEVTNPKQAVAIALSEARKSGAKIPKKKKPTRYKF
jgi:isopropylmalate/homocitrate/citramalate synthase